MTDIGRVLAQAPVLDGHNDLAWELRQRCWYDLDVVDIGADQRAVGLHTDIPRLRAGGLGAQFWSVWVPCGFPDPITATLEQIDAVHALIRRYPGDLVLARNAADVRAAMDGGRIASLIGIEGGHQIDGSLGVLRMMYKLGARYMTLTHNRNTSWADSATDRPEHGGLTDFGRDVVREMNRLGMIADLSHVADSTMHDALDVSVAPAFFSHSSARALCSHPRNVPDDVLKRVPDSDGVVLTTFVPGFLTEDCHAWMDAMDELDEEQRHGDPAAPGIGSSERPALRAWLDAHPRPPCGVADVADHIEHIREVAGVRAVGLGGDFDGIVATPDGLPDVSAYPALLAELADRGWSETELTGLTSRNALRVLAETERVATAGPDERS